MSAYPPNHRAPCNGWPAAPNLLPSHYKEDEAMVRRWINVTKVYDPSCSPECAPCQDNPPCDPQLPPVPPYPRPVCEENAFGGDCVAQGCNRPDCADPGHDGPRPNCIPCGPWPVPIIKPVVEGTAVYDNTYVLSDLPQYLNKALCKKIGFKSLYGSKNWHGRVGLLNYDGLQIQTAADAVTDGNPICAGSEPLHNVPIQTRYLTATIVSSLTAGHTIDHQADNTVFTRNISVTVDRYSGKQTLNNCEKYYVNPDTGDTVQFDSPFLASLYPSGGWTPPVLYPDGTLVDYSNYNPFTDDSGHPYGYAGVFTIVTHTDTELEFNFVQENAGGSPVIYSFHLTLSDPYTADEVHDDIQTALATWDLKDDVQIPFRIDSDRSRGPMVAYNERSPTVPSMDIQCCQYHIPDSPTPDPCTLPWVDTSLPYRPSQPEGCILGMPTPNGSDLYFDFFHTVYGEPYDGTCDGEPDGSKIIDVEFYGAYSPYPHATLWADETAKYNLPEGPFQIYNSLVNPLRTQCPCGTPLPLGVAYNNFNNAQAGQSLIVCVWFEAVMFAKPSQNFARPCGNADAKELDNTEVDCDEDPKAPYRFEQVPCKCGKQAVSVRGASNTTPILITPDRALDLDDGDVVTICQVTGNTAANGKFKVQTIGSNFQLLDFDTGEPVAGNGDYGNGGIISTDDPADANTDYWNDSGRKGQFVLKRWDYDFRDFMESYRVILDSLRRDSQNEQRARDGIPPCPDIPTTDPVRFNMTPVTINPETGFIEPSEFFIGSGSYWLKAMTATQLCVSLETCYPTGCIVNYSDESGYDDDGQWVEAMGRIDLDDRYGSMRLWRVEQWMSDRLWKAPGQGFELLGKCDDGCGEIEEDNGSCKQDYDILLGEEIIHVCIYPRRPYVEALAGYPPDDAGVGTPPMLPDGALPLGCDNYVENLNAVPVVGGDSECDPPYEFSLEPFSADGAACPSGYFISGNPVPQGDPAWVIYLRERDCIEVKGRFWKQYKKNS